MNRGQPGGGPFRPVQTTGDHGRGARDEHAGIVVGPDRVGQGMTLVHGDHIVGEALRSQGATKPVVEIPESVANGRRRGAGLDDEKG